MPEFTADTAAEREIFSPSQLVRLARDLLEDTFPLIWIEGEISNFSRPASGHLYFSLKDAQAQIRCAMFKNRAMLLRFRPADGTRVLARVRVSLYEARGEFQLIVEHLEEAGEGALLRAFEQLKARLAAEGLFDAAKKRPLPKLPRRIGVVTSATGAAIRDVLSVLARRFPLAEVDVIPVPVQGKEAPPAIVKALQAASAGQRHDVLLLTRGGGSLEDLWAFNDEAVARAIRASAIPVVSAIGHEVDFTIADFAADLRAPTPSAAAEILVPDGGAIRRTLQREEARLEALILRRLQNAAQRIDHAWARLRAQHPRARLQRGGERLAHLHARLQAQHPLIRLAQRSERLAALQRRLAVALERRLDSRKQHLAELARALNAVSPLATLQRGYAILLDRDDGHVLRSAAQVHAAPHLIARLADGDVPLRREAAPRKRKTDASSG
ncbi:MAG: exodeoxyribonuclease VII large subunit [Rudaea sp.]|uniref:exodeoxyribonuclease VII large subunit n=1 Tax=unclassified Rudaea TaxID=2627037 RepID=UPI0010F7EDBE|nr:MULTISPECIES: exodeoxyribonuclease VII large subunit [unclassified Rudaea]MBN8888199.1 exodeoxyribonuclease VII large subunit [Rudaea sp.]